jgi:hypothetical protein
MRRIQVQPLKEEQLAEMEAGYDFFRHYNQTTQNVLSIIEAWSS